MGALDKFLATLPDSFDLEIFFDPSVKAIESTVYSKPSIYKYYSHGRRGFFSKAQVRFSPREALNDPFEMSRRWQETRAEGLRKFVQERLAISVPAALSNKQLILSMLLEGAAENGVTISDAQRHQAEEILASAVGQQFLANQLKQIQQMMPFIVDLVFNQLEANLDQTLDNVISTTGVLSLTEDALNNQMWAHYGDQGKGFVLGFDPTHSFFFHIDGSTRRALLRKVIYTDQPTENFWKNPYYLFLVKATGWAYEREWRLIKNFSDSQSSDLSISPPVHLWDVPRDMIQSVHFGYSYDHNEMSEDIESLLALGARPRFYQVSVDRTEGMLVENPVK